jgi:hypothetical protein
VSIIRIQAEHIYFKTMIQEVHAGSEPGYLSRRGDSTIVIEYSEGGYIGFLDISNNAIRTRDTQPKDNLCTHLSLCFESLCPMAMALPHTPEWTRVRGLYPTASMISQLFPLDCPHSAGTSAYAAPNRSRFLHERPKRAPRKYPDSTKMMDRGTRLEKFAFLLLVEFFQKGRWVPGLDGKWHLCGISGAGVIPCYQHPVYIDPPLLYTPDFLLCLCNDQGEHKFLTIEVKAPGRRPINPIEILPPYIIPQVVVAHTGLRSDICAVLQMWPQTSFLTVIMPDEVLVVVGEIEKTMQQIKMLNKTPD